MAMRVDRDEELLTALRQHEPAAAERLVTTYGGRAYGLARRITGNAQDGEEIVQDAFLAVIRKIDSFRGESAFGSWLFRIVANAAYKRVRSRQRRGREVPWDEVLPVFDGHSRHVTPISDWSPLIDDPSVQTELRTALTAAIDELPAAYRAVLVLRDVEGLSTLEITDALGLSVSAVKTRVHRARLFLRKRLGEAMATLGPTPGSKRRSRGDDEGAASRRRPAHGGGSVAHVAVNGQDGHQCTPVAGQAALEPAREEAMGMSSPAAAPDVSSKTGGL